MEAAAQPPADTASAPVAFPPGPFPAPQGFPVTTRQAAALIGGVPTEFVLSAYDDRILVVATQLGKLGTILSARKDASEDVDSAAFTVQVLLGRRDEEVLQAGARRLVQAMADAGCTRPLLLCLGLQEHSPAAVKAVLEVIQANRVW